MKEIGHIHTFRDKFPIYLWRHVELWQHHHAFSHFFPPYPLQREGGGLAGRANGYGYTFSLDGADMRGRELTQGIGANEDGVTGVDHPRLDNPTHNGPYKRHGKGVVYVELERSTSVVVSVMG